MSQLQRIIVGNDLTEGSDSAVKYTAVLAARYGAALHFVDVIEPIHTYQRLSHPSTPPDTPEELAQQAGAKLEAPVRSPAFASLHAEYEVRIGETFCRTHLSSACLARRPHYRWWTDRPRRPPAGWNK